MDYDAFSLGPRVLVTRSAEDAPPLAEALAAVGCRPVLAPVLERRWRPDPLVELAARVPDADWLLVTSAASAEILAIAAPNAWRRARFAAVGPATERRLAELGLSTSRALVPDRATAADLVAAMGDLRGQVVIYPKADLAAKQTEDALTRAGALVHSVVAYENTAPAGYRERLLAALPVEVTTLLSGSAAERLAEVVPEDLRAALGAVVVIGPSTEAVARDRGLPVHAIADPHTIQGVVSATVRALRAKKP